MTNLEEKRSRAKCDLNTAVVFLSDAKHLLDCVLKEARQALMNDEDRHIEEVIETLEWEIEKINYRGGLWRLNHDGRGGED